jgi:hypothetical protein
MHGVGAASRRSDTVLLAGCGMWCGNCGEGDSSRLLSAVVVVGHLRSRAGRKRTSGAMMVSWLACAVSAVRDRPGALGAETGGEGAGCALGRAGRRPQ